MPTPAMNFNHASFPSEDVVATSEFFVRHLGCQASPIGSSVILKRDGFDIVIEDASNRQVNWPHNFHIGFELASVKDLISVFDDFKRARVEFVTNIISHARGSRFFCRIPGGIMLEMNTREDADETYRTTFSRR